MSENVQVAVRVRPFNDRERELQSTSCIRMVKETQQTIITDPETMTDKSFTFDFSYNSFVPADDPDFASQDTVWDDIGVKVLEHAWNGFNVSLFAYGQTGSGKSFSMVGYGAERGIIPRASEVLFARIEASANDVTFKVEASMMEIYNERVKGWRNKVTVFVAVVRARADVDRVDTCGVHPDLFNPSSDNLKIRDHPRHGPYAEGLTRHAVASHEEIRRLMDAGILARTTAATNMNATSSRAHTIFQLVVTQTEQNPADAKPMDKVSRINLIDLAGSERAASTGATGARLKEGAAINQSLSALGNCISALADLANGKKKVLVPYRNSRLTHLLKDSLGGNSKTIMIAALSPASVNYSETLSTLRYADRAKQIKTRAVVNEDPNQLLIRQLKEELDALRKAMMENGASASRPSSREREVLGSHEDEGDDQSQPHDSSKEQEIAKIREQLEEHQRLLQESEKSWQDRLKETEELARKREEQLKMLGLVTDTSESNSKALVEPHLLNLHEDQLMSEKLRFFLRDGMNRIGRLDAEQEQTFVVGGLGILKEHCVITYDPHPPHEDSCPDAAVSCRVTLKVLPGAQAHINGRTILPDEDAVLRHCDRIVLGNATAFRMVIPADRDQSANAESSTEESHWSWQFAMSELNNTRIKCNQELEEQAQHEKQEMDNKIHEMEQRIAMEQALAEEKLQQQRAEWEVHVRELNSAMQLKEAAIRVQMQTEGEKDKLRLAVQLAQQESKLTEELAKAEISLEKKRDELLRKQSELESSLQEQMRAAKLLSQQKERERAERAKFDEHLLQAIPLISEGNAIAEELRKNTVFALKLLACHPTPSTLSGLLPGVDEDEAAINHGISAKLKVQVTFQEMGTYRSVLWELDCFVEQLYRMRDMYQAFIENNRVLVHPTSNDGQDSDPFRELPHPQHIGTSYLFLSNVVVGCKFSDSVAIVDDAGVNRGMLQCEVVPTVLSHDWQAKQQQLIETCPDDPAQMVLPRLDEFIDTNLRLCITVENLRGIPGKLCKDVFVSMMWCEGEDPQRSSPAASASVDPALNFSVTIEKAITTELIGLLETRPIQFDVFGMVPSSDLTQIVCGDGSEDAAIAEQDDEDTHVVFMDMSNTQPHYLERQRSSRRRVSNRPFEDASGQLAAYREQLALQEKALADNTQELEQRVLEADALQQELQQTKEERDRLRDTVDEMTRTTKRLQERLEQAIMQEHIREVNARIQAVIFEDAMSTSPMRTAVIAPVSNDLPALPAIVRDHRETSIDLGMESSKQEPMHHSRRSVATQECSMPSSFDTCPLRRGSAAASTITPAIKCASDQADDSKVKEPPKQPTVDPLQQPDNITLVQKHTSHAQHGTKKHKASCGVM